MAHDPCPVRYRRHAASAAGLPDFRFGDHQLAGRVPRAQRHPAAGSVALHRARPVARPALPANPQDPARLRRDRLLAAGPASGNQRASPVAGRGGGPAPHRRRLTARVIDGKAAALALRQTIATEVTRFRHATCRAPGLAVVLVGDDPASAVYVRSKDKATREAGMESIEHRLPAETTQDELVALVDALNANPAIDGILVQLPLPPQIDERVIITRID